MNTNSKRTYEVVMVEGGDEFNRIAVLPIGKILKPLDQGKDWEYIYALNDIVDKILDMKDGESIYFQPIRDNYDSKGIILRTA